jgi:tRNA (guanine-N7-)-methyltransferase
MQRMIEITSPLFLPLQETVAALNWEEIFGNNNPLALEIGCGIGDFIAKTASDCPEINFIALDYYNKGCDKTCRRLEKLGMSNVRVLRVEAREFVADHIPLDSLTAVYINCPDPWPKKRHRKRRLVSSEFIDFIGSYLKTGGDFFFATDFEDYGLDVAALMATRTDFANMLAPDLCRYDIANYHRSKYMLKFMAEGKHIRFVHYRKL